MDETNSSLDGGGSTSIVHSWRSTSSGGVGSTVPKSVPGRSSSGRVPIQIGRGKPVLSSIVVVVCFAEELVVGAAVVAGGSVVVDFGSVVETLPI